LPNYIYKYLKKIFFLFLNKNDESQVLQLDTYEIKKKLRKKHIVNLFRTYCTEPNKEVSKYLWQLSIAQTIVLPARNASGI